jgi:hypothetical protein
LGLLVEHRNPQLGCQSFASVRVSEISFSTFEFLKPCSSFL